MIVVIKLLKETSVIVINADIRCMFSEPYVSMYCQHFDNFIRKLVNE